MSRAASGRARELGEQGLGHTFGYSICGKDFLTVTGEF